MRHATISRTDMAQPARVVPGERAGGVILFMDGYRYERNRTMAGRKIYWRCADQMCRTPLQTNDFHPTPGPAANMIVLVPNGLHPHLPEDDRVERNDFVQRIKQRIQQDPSLPIKRAYDTEFLALPANGRMHAATFEEVRSALQRFRMAFVPALPPDIYGVNIQGTWAETWDGRRKLLASDNVLGVTIFASDEELVTLSQCDEIYIDGTFRTAPFPFTQIVVIHGKYHGWILPLVFALSTGKRQNQYRYILQEVATKIRNLNNNFSPNLIVTDFEVALINAIDAELPQTEKHGCYFHFSQSLMRKISTLGLQVAYQQNPQLQRVVRRMLALGYIPVPHVRLMFV